uniref:Structural maintenance of chromosomes protein 6B-like n=1 Tax=Tanacetum cinerariifolium TaxID=118510 RepID=A0A699H784_TANCI|nr:structural maintenance of chromosomes protein 6B-like [Tanacetum cinerariifolium]
MDNIVEVKERRAKVKIIKLTCVRMACRGAIPTSVHAAAPLNACALFTNTLAVVLAYCTSWMRKRSFDLMIDIGIAPNDVAFLMLLLHVVMGGLLRKVSGVLNGLISFYNLQLIYHNVKEEAEAKKVTKRLNTTKITDYQKLKVVVDYTWAVKKNKTEQRVSVCVKKLKKFIRQVYLTFLKTQNMRHRLLYGELRIRFVDSVAGECLSATMLLYCGRTLLENFRDNLDKENSEVVELERQIAPIEKELDELRGKIKSLEHIEEISQRIQLLRKKHAWSIVYDRQTNPRRYCKD